MNILEQLDFEIDIKDPKYFYNGNPVPRVTAILSAMLNKDYLLKWANSLGWRRKSHEKERDLAAEIGTYVHNAIEQYMVNGVELDTTVIPIHYKDKVINGYESFKLWWSKITSRNEIEIVACEKELVCPWYGGTCDFIIKINGKYFLGDFKTSNNVSYEYFLQLAAYRNILRLENIELSGCLILQVDKNEVAFEEYVLMFEQPDHYQFIEQCFTTFNSLVYAYYNRLESEKQFKNIFK